MGQSPHEIVPKGLTTSVNSYNVTPEITTLTLTPVVVPVKLNESDMLVLGSWEVHTGRDKLADSCVVAASDRLSRGGQLNRCNLSRAEPGPVVGFWWLKLQGSASPFSSP